uniref:BCL2 associated agonist of cell death b n=1 Tax=Esox lucius TaxID=8010 RepID=A0AAY5KFD0_ESOLU
MGCSTPYRNGISTSTILPHTTGTGDRLLPYGLFCLITIGTRDGTGAYGLFWLRNTHIHPLILCSFFIGEGRIRLNSESQVFATSGGERSGELQGLGQGLNCVATEGLPFRVRSQSAPPALWAAKRYGRQLRRMSDEFDTWLDKGQMKRVKSAGAAKQMTTSPSWWAFLFSHKETETEKTPNLIITEPRSSE